MDFSNFPAQWEWVALIIGGVAFLMALPSLFHCVFTKKDTEGLELKGGFEAVKEMLEMIVFRKGIGDILADGTYGIVNRFGKECEKYCVHVKGINVHCDGRFKSFLTPEAFSEIGSPGGGEMHRRQHLPSVLTGRGT